MGTDRRRPRWLLSDAVRSSVAALSALLITPLLVLALARLVPELQTRESLTTANLTVWFTLFPITYTGLTVLAFRGLSGEKFAAAVDVESARWRLARSRGREWLRSLLLGGRVLGWALTVAVCSLLAVLAIVFLPGLRRSAVILVLALAMVVGSWVSVMVAYAIHYARIDVEQPGSLQFPGHAERGFSDYVYVALAGQTTFGATDVEITTRRMRGVSMGQGVLAFVFNTVIVAMVVSLLLGAGS